MKVNCRQTNRRRKIKLAECVVNIFRYTIRVSKYLGSLQFQEYSARENRSQIDLNICASLLNKNQYLEDHCLQTNEPTDFKLSKGVVPISEHKILVSKYLAPFIREDTTVGKPLL